MHLDIVFTMHAAHTGTHTHEIRRGVKVQKERLAAKKQLMFAFMHLEFVCFGQKATGLSGWFSYFS